jgi:hypothetical protein
MDSTSAISLIISAEIITPDSTGPYYVLYATGSTFLSNPYQAELLAAAVAASLSSSTRFVHIITDCKSIVTQIEHLRNSPESIPRTDITPFLIQLVTSNTTFTWVKAHSDLPNATVTTPLQHGNQLADSYARRSDLPQWANPPRKYAHMNLLELLPPFSSPTAFTSDHPLTLPSTRAIHQHCEQLTINAYITNRSATHFHHHLYWEDFSWASTGRALQKLLKLDPFPIPFSKRRTIRYFFKTLYDKFRNDAFKFKIQHPATDDNSTHLQDFPCCPLCTQVEDSTTHLFCHCPHNDIVSIRSHCLSALRDEARNSGNETHYDPFIAALIQDSRAWACLLPLAETPSHFTTTAALILTHTLPAIHQMWKVYNQITHVVVQPTPPDSQLSHNILSRSLQVLNIPGPSMPALPQPSRSRTNNSITLSHDIRSYFPSGRPHMSSTPSQHWQSPSHPISFSSSSIRSPHFNSPNSFQPLPIEPTTPHDEFSQYILPAATSPPKYYPSTPINRFTADSTLAAKQHLATQINHTYQQAAGDGNCLLNAFIMGLQLQTEIYDPTLHTPDSLRTEIYHYISSPLGSSLRSYHSMSHQEVVSILTVPGTRPSDLELPAATALANLLQVNIRIFSLFSSNGEYTVHSLIHTSANHAPTITLLHNYYHYDYLRPQPAPD